LFGERAVFAAADGERLLQHKLIDVVLSFECRLAFAAAATRMHCGDVHKRHSYQQRSSTSTQTTTTTTTIPGDAATASLGF
jgi:hypothetical protein